MTRQSEHQARREADELRRYATSADAAGNYQTAAALHRRADELDPRTRTAWRDVPVPKPR